VRAGDLVRFVALAALFGASFLFMRIAAPHFGPWCTAELRVGIAALVLTGAALATRRPLMLGHEWRRFLVAGAFNSALPFALFSYAAIHIPAGYSAILNALMPIWAALFSSLMLGERLTWRILGGVVAAMSGISLLVRLGPVELSRETVLAGLACVLATVFYGFAGSYTKKYLTNLPAHAGAANTMLGAAVVLVVPALLSVPDAAPPARAWLAVAGLACFSSALAFFIYYQLIMRIGATQIGAVTFVLPAFGIFWGWLVLGEPVTTGMLGGFALVGVAAAMVLGIGPFRPR
jgi:drug/metabolite transporter (DMT)-like permease